MTFDELEKIQPYCCNCVFWYRFTKSDDVTEGVGTCHRYPPVYDPTYEDGSEITVEDPSCFIQPPTGEEDWCGEFRSEWTSK